MIPHEQLLQGYANGIFPMADGKKGTIQWYSADPRGIIDLEDFHIPKRLVRYLRNKKYTISLDQSFQEVIRSCAQRSEKEGVWISEEIIESYINLFNLGFAHSVEVRMDNKLVAGLYGVALKGAFFGESMFNLLDYPNTSKFALYYLIQHLNERKFLLLDIQMITSTTQQFGAKLIRKEEYYKRLMKALQRDCKF